MEEVEGIILFNGNDFPKLKHYVKFQNKSSSFKTLNVTVVPGGTFSFDYSNSFKLELLYIEFYGLEREEKEELFSYSPDLFRNVKLKHFKLDNHDASYNT